MHAVPPHTCIDRDGALNHKGHTHRAIALAMHSPMLDLPPLPDQSDPSLLSLLGLHVHRSRQRMCSNKRTWPRAWWSARSAARRVAAPPPPLRAPHRRRSTKCDLSPPHLLPAL
jgi:hypothetical protein